MKKFLIQRVIDGEIVPSLMNETELINYINMADCHGEDYEIFDVSKFGETHHLHYVGWQPICLTKAIREFPRLYRRWDESATIFSFPGK